MNSKNPFHKPGEPKVTCLQMLQTILDGEATEEQQQYFKLHMDACMPCYKTHRLDMVIKQLIQATCCGKNAPQELVERIKKQLPAKSR